MSNAVIEKFRTERDEVIAQAEALVERDGFTPEDETYQALKTRAETLNRTLEDLSHFQATKSAADSLDATLARSSRKVEAVRERAEQPASFGELFTRSAEFEEYRGRGTMSPVELDGFLRTRAVHTLSDFELPRTVREPAERPFSTPIQDSATVVPVVTNSVDVVTYEFTSAAAVVAEGATKPEAGMAQTITPITLDTIAHWVQFSRQLYADAGAVASRVDSGLRRGILKKLEAEAEDAITGGTYLAVASSGDLMGGIRKAIGELQEEYSPSAVYLNPADWADLDIASQGDGSNGVMRTSYWSLSIVPSADVAAGTALVADAGVAFEVYRREAVQTFLTDSHASTFTANVLTLLAEARQKTVVVDPAAVRQVTTA